VLQTLAGLMKSTRLWSRKLPSSAGTIARQLFRLEDLMQAGMIGLLEASQRYATG